MHLFATRIAGHHQPFIIRRIIDTNSIAYQLSDLHKSHLDDDTLALTIDLEWAVWNQLKSHAFLLENQVPWQPFKIIRIKGLLDYESTHNVVEFSVSKPRPNPFNPITTFDVVLPSTGHITISAYDVLGRRIDLIRNETLSAGIHEIHWDAQKYTSGVYFLRVDYQNKVFYNRVSLIK